MGLEVVTVIPLPMSTLIGVVGAVVLTLSLIAAFFVNKTDKARKSSNSNNAAKRSAAKVDETAPDKERCTILFGTQTGTAERFAKSLRSQLESKYGANTAFDVVDIEHYNAEERLAKEKLVFFLMATYGDGEPTDNAADFYNYLMGQADAATADDPVYKVRHITAACRNPLQSPFPFQPAICLVTKRAAID